MTTWTMTALHDGEAVATYETVSRQEAAELIRAAMVGADVAAVRERQLGRAGERSPARAAA